MSAVRLALRPALVAVAALVLVGVVAGPAAAASVSCRLDGLPGRMTAGGPGAGLRASISNPKPENISDVQVVYTIRLDGLTADQVKFDKVIGSVRVEGGDGEIRVVDTAKLVFRRASLSYVVQFLAGAPSGRASLTMDVFLDRERIGSARASTTVQGAKGSPTNSPSPAPTGTLALGPADVSPGASGPAIAPAAQPASGLGEEGSLWPLYLLGILLVVGGGGAAAFLLLRRSHESDGDEELPGYPVMPYPGPAQYPGPARYQGAPYPDVPTAVLPVVTGSGTTYGTRAAYPPVPAYPPPAVSGATAPLAPASDPWNGEGRHPRAGDGGYPQ